MVLTSVFGKEALADATQIKEGDSHLIQTGKTILADATITGVEDAKATLLPETAQEGLKEGRAGKVVGGVIAGVGEGVIDMGKAALDVGSNILHGEFGAAAKGAVENFVPGGDIAVKGYDAGKKDWEEAQAKKDGAIVASATPTGDFGKAADLQSKPAEADKPAVAVKGEAPTNTLPSAKV